MGCAFIRSAIATLLVPKKALCIVSIIATAVSVLLYLVIDDSHFLQTVPATCYSNATDNVVLGVGVSSSARTTITRTTHIEHEGNEHNGQRGNGGNEQRQNITVEPSNYTSTAITMPANLSVSSYFKLGPRRYSNILSSTWKPNASNMQRIRQEIQSFGDATKSLVLAKDNVHPEQLLKYSWGPGSVRISRKVHDILPETPLFGNRRYKTCSVVGNGGILVGSGCGHVIDSSEYVFRCNLPPLKAYSNDTGKKSNLVTFNQSIIRNRYRGRVIPVNWSKFEQDLMEHELVWIPIYGETWSTKSYITLAYKFNETKIPFIMQNPHHRIRTSKYWKTRGIKKKATTGMYFVSVAIELCDEVQVYGFWPFHTSPDGDTLPFHYYKDKIPFYNMAHNFSQEFAVLVQLHQLGIIKMNMKCL